MTAGSKFLQVAPPATTPPPTAKAPACREVCHLHEIVIADLQAIRESALAAIDLKKAIADLATGMFELHAEIVLMRQPISPRQHKFWFMAKSASFVLACSAIALAGIVWVILSIRGGVHVQIR
jgi:hypothetical protein